MYMSDVRKLTSNKHGKAAGIIPSAVCLSAICAPSAVGPPASAVCLVAVRRPSAVHPPFAVRPAFIRRPSPPTAAYRRVNKGGGWLI